ncbi:hypothetical protein BC941DRAFT_511980 [Chlamydoabsidia padenii]|nr:hypothetical protein BC941DRAFT_511980 [Chlamydoabsidia padenii]
MGKSNKKEKHIHKKAKSGKVKKHKKESRKHSHKEIKSPSTITNLNTTNPQQQQQQAAPPTIPTKRSSSSVIDSESTESKKKLQPRTKTYISDSDSDDTDNDTSRPTAKPISSKVVPVKKKAPVAVVKKATTYSSASDSDSTDNDTTTRRPIKPTLASSSAKKYISNSDSDSTDNDTTRAPAIKKAIRTPTNVSDSNSDTSDDDDRQPRHTTNPTEVASALIDGSSNNSKHISITSDPVFLKRKQITRSNQLGEFSNNRLQHHMMYRDKTQEAKVEYARRFVDEADKYTVTRDFFVSDSESDTDSDDDYSTPPPSWHDCVANGAVSRQMMLDGKWDVKTGRFTKEEAIRLEKRLKKICRREGKTLEDLRMMLDEDFILNKPFWIKIAKVFPNRSMSAIMQTCRNKYNTYAYSNKPWTEEMDRLLVEYMKVDGKNFKLIEKKMNRPRSELLIRAKQLMRPEDRQVKKVVQFTEEEKQDLAQAVDANTQDGIVKWSTATEAYNAKHPNNTRSIAQCQYQWRCRNRHKGMPVAMKLAIIRSMKRHGWKKETDMIFVRLADEFGYTNSSLKEFYLKSRTTIPDFEKKDVPDILDILEKRFDAMLQSLQD